MIKINLRDDYLDEIIEGIFLKLAKSIIEKLQDVNLELYDDMNNLKPINLDNIYKFLISKNFYKYNYNIYSNNHYITDAMIKDWLALPCDRVISSLIDPNCKSNEKYKEFNRKYSFCCKEFFCNLKEFQKINKKITSKNKENFLKEYYPLYSQMVKAFSYDLLTEEDRDILISKMNINVCPYCNMNYTLNYLKNSKIKATADVDHFYVKSYYPLYSLCLYNFVPSCQICNSRLKLDKIMNVETHIYPHDNNFGDKGTFVISNLCEYIINEDDRVDIKLNVIADNNKINNSNELFQLEERYKFFESTARDLLDKVMEYNSLYQKELSELMGDISTVDIKSLIFGEKLTEKEILNVSLGKFRMDLLKDFGIF